MLTHTGEWSDILSAVSETIQIKRRRRTRILVDGDPALRRHLADEVRKAYDVVEVQEPANGLVMISMRESARRGRFYIGEVLSTECRVRIADTTGVGIIAGDDPDAARDLAAIDAAYAASLPECDGWRAAIESEERRILDARTREQAKLDETRVRFETMDGEG